MEIIHAAKTVATDGYDFPSYKEYSVDLFEDPDTGVMRVSAHPIDESDVESDSYETDKDSHALLLSSLGPIYAFIETGVGGQHIIMFNNPDAAAHCFIEQINMWEGDDGKWAPRYAKQIKEVTEGFLVDPAQPRSINSDRPDAEIDNKWVSMESTTYALMTVFGAA